MGYTYIEKDKESGVTVIWLDQPGEKVNKLSMDIIDEFKETMEKLEKDDEVKALVLISKKKDTFIAGADLEQVLKVDKPEEAENISRTANEFLLKISQYPKPIVAAIHGAALGGGLEVAMACHYRIATDSPKTVLALPEVRLGLLPGAGGTQRLPRLIGMQKALPLMLAGSNVYPKKAKKLGLIDDVVQPYILLHAAKIAAIRYAGKKRQKRKRAFMEKMLEGNFIGRSIVSSMARKQVLKKTYGHYPAPIKIIECVAAGLNKGLKKGIEIEAKNFGELVCHPTSEELIGIFFHMNSRKKNPWAEHVRPINKVGILGSGFMGAGIAQVTADKQKIPAIVKDIHDKALENAEKGIWKDISKKVKKRVIRPFERDVIMSRIFTTTDYQDLAGCDIVVEAVFEELEIKRKVIAETEAVVGENCIFASNTSCIPITEIAAEAKHPERILGMHYFSPVPVMPLLEIIVTEKTADWALAGAFEMGIRQGKTVIVVNDGPGFYTTRILAPFMNEAALLLEEGGAIPDLDLAMKRFGFPVGPITLMDEVGIDVGGHVARIMSHYFAGRGAKPNPIIEKLAQADYKGRKNGKGFYLYPKEKGKKKTVNYEIYQYFGGSKRKKIPESEIQKRMAMIMVNEAARCLEEKILRSADDGDVGAIFGIGFPPFLGGPFRYLDSLGLEKVVSDMEIMAGEYGDRFVPAQILKDMAGNDQKFYDK